MPDSLEQIWKRTLDLVRAHVNQRDFDTWIRPMKPVEARDHRLLVLVDDVLFSDYVQDNNIQRFLLDAFENASGQPYKIEYLYRENPSDAPIRSAPIAHSETKSVIPTGVQAENEVQTTPSAQLELGGIEEPPPTVGAHPNLLPDYVFETFVKGPSNELAYAACRAVAENPASTYNPLFIYGGVGLGKTHLLHGIAHEIARRYPNLNVRYASSETYFNELVDSIRNDRMQDFRNRYRNQCDILLIDDIQFFATKERTQEEFFHTFNALYGANKQIVFSSDRFPEEIPKIQERLRSRFQWGLIADIKAPRVETRMVILQNKAESRGLKLPPEVSMFIAGRVRSNVRQLEGALTKLAAHTALNSIDVTLPMAKEVLRDFLPEESRPLNADDIMKVVASYYRVKPVDMKGPRRHKAISLPRQVAMYLCRRHTHLSFPQIGAEFGNRDHTTVMSGVRRIERQLAEEDPQLLRSIETLNRQLES